MRTENKKKRPELLSPAGSVESLNAAISGGADAVYMGGLTANARVNAKNFTDTELCGAVKLLHSHGRRAYITLNTLHSDRELMPQKSDIYSPLLAFAERVVSAGADALIVQDLGLAKLLRHHFPETALHASTQAAVHNKEGADILHSLGFSRVVLARELDRRNIADIIENAAPEAEIFVHGALCSSYSGRCQLSCMLGGTRSANCGSCAQPCRLRYAGSKKDGYLLSLKDLCLAGHMEDIIALAPACIKIEGRMKPPAYVYSTAKIYRACLDESRNATVEEIAHLAEIFSRQGFTDGYYTKKTGASMYGRRIDASASKAEVQISAPKKSEPITAGKPQINTEAYKLCINKNIKINPLLTLTFNRAEQYKAYKALEAELSANGTKLRIYRTFLNFSEYTVLSDKAGAGIKLPPVTFDDEYNELREKLTLIRTQGYNPPILTENIGQVPAVMEQGLELHGGAGLNITNSVSLAAHKDMGFASLLLSAEVNTAQIRDISKTVNTGISAYGRTQVMVTENCAKKSDGACGGMNRDGGYYITDRTGEKFYIACVRSSASVAHRNIIYNSVPLWLADRQKELRALGLFFISLDFTDENPETVRSILKAYAGLEAESAVPGKYTRGYMGSI